MKFILASIACLALAGVDAHVTANPNKAAPGSYLVTYIRIPHGCGESSTNKVVLNFTSDFTTGGSAENVAGWKVTYGYPPVDKSANATVKPVATSIVWEADKGNELPSNQFKQFGVSIKTPLTAPNNNTLYFPIMQYCINGTEDWSSWPGNPGENPSKTPAPTVKLINETTVEGGAAKAPLKSSASLSTVGSFTFLVGSLAVYSLL